LLEVHERILYQPRSIGQAIFCRAAAAIFYPDPNPTPEESRSSTMADPNANFDAEVARIWALNREGRAEEALAMAQALVERYPDHPRTHFEYAGALDFQGREAEAVAPYQRAQELGLSGDDLPRLHVQLGSTLRNVGKAWDAAHLLEDGRAQFPDYAAIRAFRALALVDAGCPEEAVVELLDVILANAEAIGLDGYERALREYTEALRTPTR
jgi:tetratricopeptide (TPR) repeat protein